ncbi:hypothetical protein M0R19_05110 [Candidatus Pacearchaeota archaeon]|jgi:hypothetical protein|nr:hypothetical protein [Candidatus Pacearchaeota archaeon]
MKIFRLHEFFWSFPFSMNEGNPEIRKWEIDSLSNEFTRLYTASRGPYGKYYGIGFYAIWFPEKIINKGKHHGY